MATRTEELKALARERDIVGMLNREEFTDELIDLVLSGEDADALIVALFEEGLDEMLPDFEEVESLEESVVMEQVKRVTGQDN